MPKLYIKITKANISFANDEEKWVPYPMKLAMSIEANLREAFRETDILSQGYDNVSVLIDSPVVLIPLDDYSQEEAESQYRFLHTDLKKACTVESCVLPQVQAVALFAITKDLKTVIADNFEHFTILPIMAHLWEQLSQYSQNGRNRKLFCYFHDKKMEVCSFRRNYFLFQNTFEISDWHNAVFFILGIWQQLDFRSATDDLILLGDVPAKEAFLNETKGYIKRISTLHPSLFTLHPSLK